MKLDPDTLLTVPIEPPGAGPDRALDPEATPDLKPPGSEGWALAAVEGLLAAVEVPLAAVEVPLAAVELLLEEQATIPKEPPPITIAAIPVVMTLPRLLENNI
jgi:hypothetical protein